MKQTDIDSIKQAFGKLVKTDEPLSKYTTFKLGGPAKVFIEPKSNEDLMKVFAYVKDIGLPYFILGNGSNILISDEGFDGVVIKPRNTSLKIDGETVYAEAGLVLSKLAMQTAKAGLTGLEWGIAVPGNVGGSVRGNAEAFAQGISNTLVSAEVYNGKVFKTLSNQEMDFVYRGSRIKAQHGQEIVISATFKLQPADPKVATAKVKELFDKKLASQPMGERCAGCLFKNVEVDPETHQLTARSKGTPNEAFMTTVREEFWQKGIVPAGWLIEQSGLKGYSKNGAKVSEKHANFIVNDGTGTADGVLALAKEVKDKVQAKFGVELIEEVEIVK